MPLERLMAQERWQRVFLLFCLCALLLLAVAWLAIGLGGDLRANLQRAQQLEQTSNELRRLQQAIVDLEAGQRGYLLTADPSYLEPYQRAMRQLPELQAALLAVADDMAEREQLQEVERLTAAKASELEQALALQREQGREAALAFMRTDVGLNLMGQIRSGTESLIGLQQRKLNALREAVPALVQQRDTTLAVLVVLGLLAGLAAFWSLRRHLVLLRRQVKLREEATRALRESSEKSLFMANLSHEIRTPMNAIFGFAQLLEELVEGERQRFYVQAIQSSGKALLDLINDILDISKIEAGKLEVRVSPTDLRELTALLNTVFAQMALEKGLQLLVTVDPRLPRALLLDAARLRQVLFNLVGNAIRYTDCGSVEVSIAVDESELIEGRVYCEIEVRDTGIGIDQQDCERIFEPFTQLESSVRGRRGGTGLGLAIVQRLVRLMDGRIEVESVRGRGSIFRLAFPQLQVAQDAPEALTGSGRLDDLPPLKIVAVDDVKLNRDLLDHLFENTRHQLFLAAGGAEGVALTREQRPDLVLMDIRMPEVDGREALRRIRADPELADVMVVAVTASSLLDEESTLRSLFDGYVRKPITRQSLYAELNRLFESGPAASDSDSDPDLDAASVSAQSLQQQQQQIEQLSGCSVEQRAGLADALDALQQQLTTATATHASSDVTACVRGAQQVHQLLGGGGFAQLADQIDSAASMFDLQRLDGHLASLQHEATTLRQTLTEYGS